MYFAEGAPLQILVIEKEADRFATFDADTRIQQDQAAIFNRTAESCPAGIDERRIGFEGDDRMARLQVIVRVVTIVEADVED